MSIDSSVSEKKAIPADGTYQELLRIKDEITGRLLEETKKSADLAHLQSSIEEQLREGFERSLQTIRTDFVKRRKKLVPCVKQLEVASASLCKAERSLQQYSGSSNSDIKKCKRRIKAARHVLMECAPNTELFSNIQRCVHDEITFLREKLLTIPDSLCKRISQLHPSSPERDKPSDSDSDVSIDEEPMSTKQYNIKQKQIKYTSVGASMSPRVIINTRQDVKKQEARTHTSLRNKSSRLNGVDLFTSDSDSIDDSFDTGSYIPIGSHRSHNTSDELQPKPYFATGNMLSEERPVKFEKETQKYYETIGHRQNVKIRQSEIKASGDKYTYMQDSQSQAPVHNETSALSRVSRRDQLDVTPSLRVSQKRYLPTLPTKSNSDQEPQFSKRSFEQKSSEGYLHNQDHITVNRIDTVSTNKSVTDESLDIEEIEFKETVKNTRQQIIDKLKSKCMVTPKNEYLTSTMELDDTATLLAPCSSIFSESLDSTLTSIKDSGVDLKESSSKNKFNNKNAVSCHTELTKNPSNSKRNLPDTDFSVSTSLSSKFRQNNTISVPYRPEQLATDRKDVEPVYNWKRVEVFKRQENANVSKTQETRSQQCNAKESKVSLAIQKFETVSNSIASGKPRLSRSQSATGPRIKYDRSLVSNKALQPRIKADTQQHTNNVKTCTKQDNIINTPDTSLDGSTFNTNNDEILTKNSVTLLATQTTESDLENVCSRHSRKAIRDTWRHRRSRSVSTTSIPSAPPLVNKSGPVFGFSDQFMLPIHGSKCHVSRIVVLSNGYVVTLDAVHCYLVLFDSKHSYLSQYSTLEVPSGLTCIGDKTIAISYPFRSKIGLFKESGGAIWHEKDITVRCNDWLIDLSYGQKELYVMCKGGHIHILDHSGIEMRRLIVDVNGRLTINNTETRIYVTGASQITRFDADGKELSRKTGVNAFTAVLIGETLYVGDRNKHKISPLSNSARVNDLTAQKVEFPSAITIHQDMLFISSFDETLSAETTRSVRVFRLPKSN